MAGDNGAAFSAACCASAPGKAILFGEHSVVHGSPAVAAALSDLRIAVEARCTEEGVVLLELPDLDLRFEAPIEACRRTFLESCGGGKGAPGPEGACATHKDRPSAEALAALDTILRDCDGDKGALKPLLYLCLSMVVCWGGDAVGKRLKGLRVRAARVDLPVGAGLGSSAAFSVAAAAALFGLQRKLVGKAAAGAAPLVAVAGDDRDVVNGWAFAAETVIHGSPSGLDNTVSTFGGALRYVRAPFSLTPIDPVPRLRILVVNTLVPRSTKHLVAGVADRLRRMPGALRGIFAAIGAIADAFAHLSQAEASTRASAAGKPPPMAAAGRTASVLDASVLDASVGSVAAAPAGGGGGAGAGGAARWGTAPAAELFRMNHDLLRAMGVSHPALEAVVARAAEEGFAAKLTGAGGGGCALVLLSAGDDAPPDAGAVARLRRGLEEDLGFRCIESGLGGVGAAWHAAGIEDVVGGGGAPPERRGSAGMARRLSAAAVIVAGVLVAKRAVSSR